MEHMAKEKISATVDEKLLKWIDTQVAKKKFANRSHGIDVALQQLKNRTK